MDVSSVLLFIALGMPSLAYGVGTMRHQYRERALVAENELLRGIISAQDTQIKALEGVGDLRPIRLNGLVHETLRLKSRASYCLQCKPRVNAEDAWHG